MKRLFEPDVIKAQIENLIADRERIDHAITALQAALRAVEGTVPNQREFSISLRDSDITLQNAVRAACAKMIDGITRQRVIDAIEREYPMLRPKSSSVSAALINLSKGEDAFLKIAIEGQGRSPTSYSTEGELTVRLNGEEAAILMDESIIKGSGGWQSLWMELQKKFNRSASTLVLTANLRARIYHYYHDYGSGGWQSRTQRVFRREMPHLFAT